MEVLGKVFSLKHVSLCLMKENMARGRLPKKSIGGDNQE